VNDIGEITLCYTVRFRRRSRHSAARLWRAITEPEEVSRWMGGPARVDLRPGGDWYIDFSATNQGALDGIIIGFERERRLTYAWGWSVVEWLITPEAEGCSYTFVHNGLADRGEDEEGLPAGWHSFVDVLDAYLDGQTVSREDEQANWLRLKPAYREQLDRLFPSRQ
jgi:uncharacterized protein YndB with AHSA1/START domain